MEAVHERKNKEKRKREGMIMGSSKCQKCQKVGRALNSCMGTQGKVFGERGNRMEVCMQKRIALS